MTYREEQECFDSLIADLKDKLKAMQDYRTPAKTRANDHVMEADARANVTNHEERTASLIADLTANNARIDALLEDLQDPPAKTRANDSNDHVMAMDGRTRLIKLDQDLEQQAQCIAILKSKMVKMGLLEDTPAEEDALDQTMVRDVEDHGEEPIAEEVALDLMTKVRCVDEPGEDALSVTDEEAPAAAVILAQVEAHAEAQVGAQVEARDDRDSEEDGQPMTTDPSNFDDTDSEDGTVPMIVTPPKLPPAPDPIPSTAFKLAVNTVSGLNPDRDHKPELTFMSHPTTAPDQPSAKYDREWLQTSPPPDPNAHKPRSTPMNTSNQPSANYDREWLQTSPPPDPPVPTPKRVSRNRQSTDYHTPAAHIHVQVYGYSPAHNGHGGYHSNVYMDSDSEDGHGHYGDDASYGGHHNNGYDSDEYEYAGCNHYRGDSDDEGYFY